MSGKPLHMHEVANILDTHARNNHREDVKQTRKYVERFMTAEVKCCDLQYEESEIVQTLRLLPENGQELAVLVPSLAKKFTEKRLDEDLGVLYEHNPHLSAS